NRPGALQLDEPRRAGPHSGGKGLRSFAEEPAEAVHVDAVLCEAALEEAILAEGALGLPPGEAARRAIGFRLRQQANVNLPAGHPFAQGERPGPAGERKRVDLGQISSLDLYAPTVKVHLLIWVHYMRDEWVRRAGRRRLFLRPRHREAPPLLAAFLDPAAFELPIHALHPPRKQALAVVDLEREGLAVEGGVDDRPALLASLHGQDGGPSELSLIEAELQLDGARPGRRVPLLDRSQPPGADHLRGGGVLRGLRGRLDGMEQGGGCDEQEPERKQNTSLCHEMSSRRVGLSAAVGSSWIAGGHMASLLFGWTRSRRCGRRV